MGNLRGMSQAGHVAVAFTPRPPAPTTATPGESVCSARRVLACQGMRATMRTQA